MAIEELRKQQRRHARGEYFGHLPLERRRRAWQWLKRMLVRARARGKRLTPRRLGAMVARATSLSGMSSEQLRAWGRSMRAKQGGYAVQRHYRAHDIHPTRKATYVRLVRNGHAESARRFLNGECGETTEQPSAPSAPVGYRQWQVPTARPDAPPMIAAVGRPMGRTAGLLRRATLADLKP
jgi:hypothetical protein